MRRYSKDQIAEPWNNKVMEPADFTWLETDAETAARRLLGCELVSEVGSQKVRVKIVETEAYDQADKASHTFRGQSPRNSAMFKSAGHLYVYFTYGMHHCMNIVCDKAGYGSGVLIRAVEPLEGMDIIEARRGRGGREATNGPGKVAQALGIDLRLNGYFLGESPVMLIEHQARPADNIISSKRIGISRAIQELRRFYIAKSPYISKK